MSESDERGRIGAATAILERDVGTWDVEMEIHPSPGAPVIPQRAVAEHRLVGGRWLTIDFRADSGFEGHGVYGWDAAIGKFGGVWVDSLQSSFTRGEGTWDDGTSAMTWENEALHQGQIVRYREIRQTLEPGVQLYRHVVTLPDGVEHEMIRAMYRRRTS